MNVNSDLARARETLLAEGQRIARLLAALEAFGVVAEGEIVEAPPVPRRKALPPKPKTPTVAAARRLRARSAAASAPAAAVTDADTPAEARRLAILQALEKAGRAGRSIQELRLVMPDERDLTNEQRESAIANALTVLRAKGSITKNDDGKWVRR